MEIVMDIETLEIFEVIDSDKQGVEDAAEEIIEEDTLMETSEGCQCLDEPVLLQSFNTEYKSPILIL